MQPTLSSKLFVRAASRRFRADVAPWTFNLARFFTTSAHFRYQIDGAPIIRSSFHPRSKCNRQRHFDFRRPRGTKIPNFCALTPHAILFYSRAKKLLAHRFRTGQSSLSVAVSQCRKKVPWSASGPNLQCSKPRCFRQRHARNLRPPRRLVRLFSLFSSRPDEIIPGFWRSMPGALEQTRPREFSPPRFSPRKRTNPESSRVLLSSCPLRRFRRGSCGRRVCTSRIRPRVRRGKHRHRPGGCGSQLRRSRRSVPRRRIAVGLDRRVRRLVSDRNRYRRAAENVLAA